MTDMDAVFEDIMKYTRGSPNKPTQTDLKRFIREHDRKQTIKDGVLDKIVKTRTAKEYLRDANERGEREATEKVKERAEKNKSERIMKENIVFKRGYTPEGTYTTRKGERFPTFTTEKGKTAYYDSKANRNREPFTGRFVGK